MPEQFPYPEEGWSTGSMRRRGEPLEDSPLRVAGMWDSIGKIFGFPGGEAKPTEEPVKPGKSYIAKPMGEYPSDADAEFAKSHGFGYGTVAEPYIDQKTAKVYGQVRVQSAPPAKGKDKGGTTTQSFYADSAEGLTVSQILNAVNDKTRSVNIDLTRPEFKNVRDRIGNAYGKAALAVEGNAVAKLGFDPKMVMGDVSDVKTNLSGAYRNPNFPPRPNDEGIYAAMTDPSAVVHESIHRGINMLWDKSEGKGIYENRGADPEFRKKLDKVWQDLPDEEMVVRYMMVKHAGDPEKLTPAGRPDKQRSQAIEMFESKYWGEKRVKAMDALMKLAEEEVGIKRPGGPR